MFHLVERERRPFDESIRDSWVVCVLVGCLALVENDLPPPILDIQNGSHQSGFSHCLLRCAVSPALNAIPSTRACVYFKHSKD